MSLMSGSRTHRNDHAQTPGSEPCSGREGSGTRAWPRTSSHSAHWGLQYLGVGGEGPTLCVFSSPHSQATFISAALPHPLGIQGPCHTVAFQFIVACHAEGTTMVRLSSLFSKLKTPTFPFPSRTPLPILGKHQMSAMNDTKIKKTTCAIGLLWGYTEPSSHTGHIQTLGVLGVVVFF